ncbi:hypothetical protein AAFF_G00107680 [Aldrovandia affinis]|uniref:Uncharacterized protein n=1 Tax=Aldrovandia affinis TaxID=143900 RepID=A0AAD7WC04_9TELE|nr:hypothetical protein AAFF_G00107680 [Aldrovandia affinis]
MGNLNPSSGTGEASCPVLPCPVGWSRVLPGAPGPCPGGSGGTRVAVPERDAPSLELSVADRKALFHNLTAEAGDGARRVNRGTDL